MLETFLNGPAPIDTGYYAQKAKDWVEEYLQRT